MDLSRRTGNSCGKRCVDRWASYSVGAADNASPSLFGSPTFGTSPRLQVGLTTAATEPSPASSGTLRDGNTIGAVNYFDAETLAAIFGSPQI
jgi:hypothetical protein